MTHEDVLDGLRCPKCYAVDALGRARAMVEAREGERYARAFGLMEAVLERIRDEPRLQLCGKHAAEFFRMHARATARAEFGEIVASVAGMVRPEQKK